MKTSVLTIDKIRAVEQKKHHNYKRDIATATPKFDVTLALNSTIFPESTHL